MTNNMTIAVDLGKDITNELLIEQHGGYEEAKTKFRDNGSFHAERMKAALLAYRREHNIFEDGEKVVCKYEHTHLFGDVVLEIAYFRDDLKELGRFVRFTNGNDFKLDALRHATDEEIKANRRLEG